MYLFNHFQFSGKAVRPGIHTCEYILSIALETVSVFVPLLSALRLLRAGPATTPTGLCSLVVTAALAAGRGWAVFREVPLQAAREATLGRIRRLRGLRLRAVLGEVPLQVRDRA